MEGSYAVRKGAWSEEEDMLLRQEIEKHGEGNWCKVPLRAGLNRCRKSCRLRWLNYLKPSIKRGAFKEDEVDMIIRLHKLLGNRWCLISGRLPGRTANDVKNFWNTHIRKKEMSHANTTQDIVKVNVIRPKPSTVSKNFTLLHEKSASVRCFEPENSDNVLSPTLMPSENEVQWWERLLYDKEDDEMATGGPAKELGRVPVSGEIVPKAKVDTSDEGCPNCFPDFSFDMIDWDFLDADYESMTL